MKLFVLAVPHTVTSHAFNSCPFTAKTLLTCRTLQRLGHEVIHLGVEGSEVTCSENVAVVSHDYWAKFYRHPGSEQYQTRTDGPFREYQQAWARGAREAILARTNKPWEAIVCCTYGDAQIEATRDLQQFVAETGIGYRHTWAKYRVFESYAWMHFHLGLEKRFDGNGWYEAVIPNQVAPDLFDFRPDKSGDFLFLGRLNDDKGIAIAIDVAKRAGRKIKICGQGDPTRFLQGNPHASYVPAVDVAGRRQLFAEAAAFFCPTQYVEPFGNVAVEAMMSGTPVICTDWGAFTETVLHGVTGYRCRTMEQFVWAAQNIDQISPATCRQWAESHFSPARIGPMYEEYFQMLLDLDRGGWYEDRPQRTQLNWLRARFPAAVG